MLRNAFILTLSLVLSTSSCTCDDDAPGWEFYEDLGLAEPDVAVPPPDPDMPVDMPVDFALPERDAGWEPEEVVESVPLSHALNERTSLTVDENGTLYLGYHSCNDAACDDPRLTIARKARGRDWTHETVKRQRGTFGIEVARPEEVIAAFLDPTDNTFKVSRRLGANEYEFRALGVRRTGISDGLDITPDGERMFVTYANDRGDPVALFVHAQGEWRALENLDIGADASAAYERGLGSDGRGNLYLVHRGGPVGSQWGLARYTLRDGEWRERTYYQRVPRVRPSSLVVTDDGTLCIAGDSASNLVVTCGDMVDLERDRWDLDEEVALGAGGYSSMLEGSDGSLYVAYPSENNTELRLAKKSPDDVWSFETVFEKNAYGVSTIIDKDDLLVISYYTCGTTSCSLEVISRPQ